MMPELPPEFIQTIQNTFGNDGKHWLKSLPALVEEASHRWGLEEIKPVPNLSYNFVAFARHFRLHSAPRRDTGNVVLKIGVPNRELTSEIAALRLYHGRGACRLLEADPENGVFLLERLQPGNMLSTLEDDERATRLAAVIMKNLWKCSADLEKHPVTSSHSVTTTVVSTDFIQLNDWFDGFKRLRQRYDGGTGPLPERLVETAESLSAELLAENKEEMLLHGDFHHFNVLESARGWLAIDPKGVIGPRGYEVGPLLINPNDCFLTGSNPKVQTAQRIAILSEMLGMGRERIRAWGVCHAVLSAWWSIEDNDPNGGVYSLRCADLFIKLQV